ncbi:hypothetical protein N7495_004457 [Penicillium taxi]|uniref:uncharacterized protein n=1 Tax=Penicillium taxi TaxID=168475 RepID=UPI002545453C|nr:uncharacterized protein N7495_004457 [Penicillium taxi]KAJ5899713.1 hypothetical protein N7495_004457 [Penicillium taxi]
MSTNSDQEDPIADFHIPRIPYNEDMIVKIINETYHLYQQLNYIATWELIWPPEGGHMINQALCEKLHLDPAIALTCSTDEGSSAIMDLKENTIRVWDFNDGPPGDDLDNYRSYPPFHAPTFLSTHLERHDDEEYLKIKKTLQEQFGWPYDFREEECKAVAKVTWERILRDEPDFELEPGDSDLPPGMERDQDFNGPFPQPPR